MSSLYHAGHMAQLARPSPLACTECRRKHLKCDASMPICSRCIERGLSCSYTPSRRGYSSRRRSPMSRKAAPAMHSIPGDQLLHDPTSQAVECHVWTDAGHAVRARGRPDARQQGSRSTAPRSFTQPPYASASNPVSMEQSPYAREYDPPSDSTSESSLRSGDEHLTNLYYSHFHESHPILVPRTRFFEQDYPDALGAVVRFIGSHYATNISSDSLRANVAGVLAANNEASPEMVQALLLYAVSLHARNEPMDAIQVLARASDTAIAIGMHKADFAAKAGHQDPVRIESLRRTWWELYVTDGYLAALHRQTSFRTDGITSETALPCSDNAYVDGIIPPNPISMAQFDARLFADDDCHFSSYCYRIEAVRILARVMAVSGSNDAHPDSIQAIDNSIASWKFHLPNDKAGIIDPLGQVDEMMFQAHIFIQCASIFLHFPRSELPITMPPAAEISCARQHMERVSPTSSQHAVKAIAASKDLASLAALPIEKHSPFFICGLLFACIVQLSACSAYGRSSTEPNRNRVALMIGVLKSMSRNWAIAQYLAQQLKRAASEIFNARGEGSGASSSGSSHDSGVDLSVLSGDMTWLDDFCNDGLPNQGLPGPHPVAL